MPLKRTYSSSTTIVPAGYQQTKKRRMPLKKRARRTYPTTGTVGKPMPFPVRMLATLRYCETIALTSSLTTIANYNWCCNGIYDPNLSGSGHQPYGHDTYAAIYNQYTVVRSKMTVRPSSGTTTNLVLNWGVGIEDTVSSIPNPDTWMERPTYKSRIQAVPSATDNAPLTIYWNRDQRFPGKDVYRELSAPFGANPSEIEVFNVILQQAGVTALGTAYVTVQIDYLVEMYEIKDLGDS